MGYNFLFSILFFCLHLSWLLIFLFKYGKSWIIIPFWVTTILWFALIVQIFLYLQKSLYYLFLKLCTKDLSWLFSWTLSIVLCCYSITYCSLFPCGVCEGYPFFNPLVLLAIIPELTWCLKNLGFVGALFFLTLSFLTIILGFLKNQLYFCVAIVFFVPFFAGFIFYKPHKIILQNSCFVKPWWYEVKEPMYVGYRMVYEVTKLLHAHDNISTVIMPESSFGWDINKYKEIIPILSDYSESVSVMFGAQRSVGASLRNSYVLVHNGNIDFVYDKQHLVPLMERIPVFFDMLGFGELLCQKKETFDCGSNKQDDIVSIEGIKFQLFICSELLHESKKVKGIPILFLCNDAWFNSILMSKWIRLFITYIESRYDVPVIFGTVLGLTNINQDI